MHAQHIGDRLIERGTLTAAQVNRVLARQRRDDRGFAQLAADMYQVPISDIADAIAEQVLREARPVKLVEERMDDNCLGLIDARDAWETLVLPMRYEDGELLCATTVETLPGAIELVERVVPQPCRFALADIRLLEQFIAERYHFEGIEVDEPAPAAIH